MSTRAMVNVIDGKGGRMRLYCSHDGYLRDGLGEWLYRFCESHKNVEHVSEVLCELVSQDNDFGLSLTVEDNAIDFVYDICGYDCEGLQLTCRKVDRSVNGKTSVEDRLQPPIDIEKELSKSEDWKGLAVCPFCGAEPSCRTSSRNGNTVSCEDDSCRGNALIGWFTKMHDAELAWNAACENEMRAGKKVTILGVAFDAAMRNLSDRQIEVACTGGENLV